MNQRAKRTFAGKPHYVLASPPILNEYLDKATQYAHYEQLEDGTYFGRIPGFKGVWANAPTEQECREELREVLEGWILLNIADHTPLPIVDGMTLEVGKLV